MQIYKWNDILSSLNTGKSDDFFEALGKDGEGGKSGGCGISVGSFDGLHLGHQALLKRLCKTSRDRGLLPGLVTFSRPLPSIKHAEDYQGDISTLAQRLALFEKAGIAFVIIVDFDDSFASMMGTDFFNILLNVCNLKLIAEGVDFRCGYKGATDTQAIKYWGEKNGVALELVEPVFYKPGTDEEERISSSYIRRMVSKGFLTTVAELLARPYELDLTGELTQAIPLDGVYHVKDEKGEDVRVEIKGRQLVVGGEHRSLSFI